jgi:ankyrin repeat protein
VPEILKTTSINCEVGGSYNSPLQVSSFKGHEQTVLALLEAGANVNASGGLFHTALEAACVAGHASIVHHLLEAGAALNLEHILSK